MRAFIDYLDYRKGHIFDLAVAHAKIVLIAIAIACVISILLGFLCLLYTSPSPRD